MNASATKRAEKLFSPRTKAAENGRQKTRFVADHRRIKAGRIQNNTAWKRLLLKIFDLKENLDWMRWKRSILNLMFRGAVFYR